MPTLIRLPEALDKSSQADYLIEATDMQTTYAFGVLINTIQQAFMKVLNADTTKAIEDGSKGGNNSSAVQADTTQYKRDNAAMNAAVANDRGSFDEAKEQIAGDTRGQKERAEMDKQIAGLLSYTSGLVRQGSNYGLL
ncbi:MAG: hypothetical protein OXF02_00455 [Simkaniaceae bacterium]|nr:hypothetical protein [Simkaniaceae bacterium]